MYGKEDIHYDDRLEDGPIKERTTTDILFCVAFIAFWVFSVVILVQSKKSGDITKLLRPSDGLHDCGVGKAEGFNKLFFNVDLSVTTPYHAHGIMKHAFCVKECPQKDTVWKAKDCFIAKDDPRNFEPDRAEK
jgi:hypothetical protein